MRAGTAAPPRLPPPVPVRLPAVRSHRLGCGLQVVVAERHDLPVVDARLVFRSGAAGDPPAVAGRAFIAARMLDQGTAAFTATRLADEIETLGASLETHAGWDSTVVALHVLAPRLDAALRILAEVGLRPTFPDDEFERQRSERISAITHERHDPATLAGKTFAAAVYGPRHPFGAPLGGTTESLSSLGVADVQQYHRQRAAAGNAFLVIAGDVDGDALVPALEDLFDGWGEMPPGDASAGQADANGGGPAVIVVDRPGAPQSELRIGLPGPPRRTDDYFPLLVGNTILGGAFTSRLNILLREEKGYTYGAGTRFAFRSGGGPFLASTAVFTGATADAVHDIVREVGRMGREAVSLEELDRARRYLTLGLPQHFETTGDVAERLGEVELFGLGAGYHEGWVAQVEAVTAESVADASARWLRPDALTVVVVGDAEVVVGDLERLGTGEVHVRASG
ncbi:MAG TPA: pitrilysin family protein [Longimicrobiales bacterium]|nr:pitrilysin family protein [Longimicrobiales bacterium]